MCMLISVTMYIFTHRVTSSLWNALALPTGHFLYCSTTTVQVMLGVTCTVVRLKYNKCPLGVLVLSLNQHSATINIFISALTMAVKKIDLLKYKAQWTEKMYQIMDDQSKKVTKDLRKTPR